MYIAATALSLMQRLYRTISGKETVLTVKKLNTETVNLEVPGKNDYVDLGEVCYCGVKVEYVGNVSDAKLCFHRQVDVISPDHGPSHAITLTNDWQVRGKPNTETLGVSSIPKSTTSDVPVR